MTCPLDDPFNNPPIRAITAKEVSISRDTHVDKSGSSSAEVDVPALASSMGNQVETRGDQEWVLTIPFPPIPKDAVLNSPHSNFCYLFLFPFPWDSQGVHSHSFPFPCCIVDH